MGSVGGVVRPGGGRVQENMAATKASGSKGRRSAACSPMPM